LSPSSAASDVYKRQEYTIHALQIFEKINHLEGQAFCAINLGVLFRRQKVFDKALEYLKMTIAIRRELGDVSGELLAINQIAEVYLDIENYEKAREYYLILLDGYNQIKDAYGQGAALSGLSIIYYKTGDYNKALELRLQSYERALSIQSSEGFFSAYINLALIYANLGNVNLSKMYLDSAKSFVDSKNSLYFTQDYFTTASEYYKVLGDYQKAYLNSIMLIEVNDSLYSIDNAGILENLEAAYKNEKNERERVVLALEADKNKFERNLLIILSLLLIVISIVIYRQFRKNKTANEELKKANLLKEKFFRIIAHDLKNPLGAIMSYSEILYDDYDSLTDKEKREFIGNIRKVTQTNFELLENLLFWSLSNTGKLKPEIVETDLFDVAEKSLNQHYINAENKNLILENKIQKNTVVHTDFNMISTVIRNLVSNGIKYTESGGSVSLSSITKGDEIHIFVTDTGIGMDKSELEKYTIELSSKKGTEGEKGTGLGLLLVKELLTILNGSISILSNKGLGTKIEITLPITPKQN
ncbi:MAG: tetratricopeptide repeat-containing sensor histidine kinase, partial [Ignavibacteriaceae bacterium]|nr:tetratricopeptide repeat-containing sensor histidine kinase [Ignavibacteriaceae bacterium]